MKAHLTFRPITGVLPRRVSEVRSHGKRIGSIETIPGYCRALADSDRAIGCGMSRVFDTEVQAVEWLLLVTGESR